MKIENKTKPTEVRFSSLTYGTVFMYRGDVAMKTRGEEVSKTNGVWLADGGRIVLSDDDLVIRLENAKLVIE